jgi:hypothetical protein
MLARFFIIASLTLGTGAIVAGGCAAQDPDGGVNQTLNDAGRAIKAAGETIAPASPLLGFILMLAGSTLTAATPTVPVIVSQRKKIAQLTAPWDGTERRRRATAQAPPAARESYPRRVSLDGGAA